MTNLDMLLTAEEPEERQAKPVNFGLDELHISRYAYEKAFGYANLVIKRKERSIEIGGFLTKPLDAQDRIARDAFLARDQVVGYGSYNLSAEDVLKAKKELDEKGQRIIGWWHSHGRLDTFHSETDNGNQMVLLNQISPSNYVSISQEKIYGLQSKVEGNNLVFWDPENPASEYHLELKNISPELAAQRLRILEEKRIGFAYSFVVNSHRWLRKRVPYCEIATRELCRSCINPRDVSIVVGYRIFDDVEFKINNDELIADIDERVHIEGEYKTNRKYFLPATFEEQRAAGILTKPDLGPATYQESQVPTLYHGILLPPKKVDTQGKFKFDNSKGWRK